LDEDIIGNYNQDSHVEIRVKVDHNNFKEELPLVDSCYHISPATFEAELVIDNKVFIAFQKTTGFMFSCNFIEDLSHLDRYFINNY
jgi:hypothetical protein